MIKASYKQTGVNFLLQALFQP